MPKKQPRQTRIVSTVKTVWRRREGGQKTSAAFAKANPDKVYVDYVNVQREEPY